VEPDHPEQDETDDAVQKDLRKLEKNI
jgi:hypothetical protein